MFDFTVCRARGAWVLQDDQCGELGAYETRDAALAAAGEWLRLIARPDRPATWPVLVRDPDGEWREELVPPTVLH